MLSLAYRIATMEALTPKHEDASMMVVSSKMAIGDAVKIKAGNVSDYLLSKPDKLNVSEDVPNWMPPFEKCFVEFTTSMEDETGEQVACQAGAVMWRWEYDGKDDLPPETKWHISCVSWASLIGGKKNSSISGKPILLGLFGVYADRNGRCLSMFINHFDGDILKDLRGKIACVAGMTTSFMHCKNVKQVEAKEDPGERFRKQYKVPKFTYRTLCIDPMKEVLRREGQSEATGLKRALHICRGHFSTYSDEKPLFGKYAGTFWVPDHVRGKKEHGEVVKDYEVKPANTPASERA